MAFIQMQAKHNQKHSKTWMQQDNMKLHVILTKFHIEHAQDGATVQHIHSKQIITTICPKQQVGTLQSSKLHATGNI